MLDFCIAKLAPAEAPQHFFLHLLLTANVPLWTTTRPHVSHDLRLIGRCLQFFQLECQILSCLTGKHTGIVFIMIYCTILFIKKCYQACKNHSTLLCHNLGSVCTNRTKFLSLMQNLMGNFLKLTECTYSI